MGRSNRIVLAETYESWALLSISDEAAYVNRRGLRHRVTDAGSSSPRVASRSVALLNSQQWATVEGLIE